MEVIGTPLTMGSPWMGEGPELGRAHQRDTRLKAPRTRRTLKPGEKHLKEDRCPHSRKYTR